MKMRRVVSLLLSIVVVIMLAIPISANAATSNAPNRVINLVYDDSGSMIETGGITFTGKRGWFMVYSCKSF